MSRSVGLDHIVRQPDGSSVGVWGVHVLKSAFQPIFAFRDGRLLAAAYEGLLRPFRDGAPVRPDTFFAGIPETDRCQVETLARTLHLFNAGFCLDPRASIFVNFDPSQFHEPRVAESTPREMRLVLHDAGIDPDRIVCEVTEKHARSDATLIGLVRELRAQAFRIAVDDYGVEESDMRRIDELAPDIVKFDADWVRHMMESRPGVAMLSTMAGEFAARGVETVFEGIEDSRELDLAERIGASMVQGFGLAKPELAPADFRAFRQAPAPAPAGPEAACAETTTVQAAEAPESPRSRTGRVFGRRSG